MICFFIILFVCHVNVLFVSTGESVADIIPDDQKIAFIQDDTIDVPSKHNTDHRKLPTILIVILFRNKAHTMPYFFTYLNRIEYPKDRISLWIRTDHNEDRTLDVLDQWLRTSANAYHYINIDYDNATERRESEMSKMHWSDERYMDVIRMKEEALNFGRKIWADYVFFLDADVFISRPSTLLELIGLDVPIIAPMLVSDGLYSNFWAGMTPEYYYQRTDKYKTIYNFDQQGQFDVPMVHSAVLINMNDKRSDLLTFNKTILGARFSLNDVELSIVPIDDIIIFALSANFSQIPLKISNEHLYGYVTVPLDADDDWNKEYEQLTNIKIMMLNDVNVGSVEVSVEFQRFIIQPEMDRMSLDRIFMINLLRRPERRIKMERSFQELGLDVEHVPAIDGQILTTEYLDELDVKFLPGYADPFHNRPMTKGEIGCFLSHFMIWERQVDEELNEILILEDDIRFEPYFKQRAFNVLEEARKIGGWDLIYFGRKRLLKRSEHWVADSHQLVHAGYSYWTLGYALSLQGAKKLLAARPLNNLIPVDEFLPIMFNQHQNGTWKKAFPIRNLVAWSAAPLLLFPTRYIGEDGYISDTEQSDTIKVFAESTGEKKGNKENNDESIADQSTEYTGENEKHTNENSVNNVSIDTTFIINNVNDHVKIQHPSSEQHTEL